MRNIVRIVRIAHLPKKIRTDERQIAGPFYGWTTAT